MAKEYGKFSLEQAKKLFANQYLLQSEIADFELLLKNPPSELADAVQQMPPWAIFYELPYPHFLALFLYCQGLLDVLKSSVGLDDPQEYWLDFMGSDTEQSMTFDDFSTEELSVIFSLTYASMVHVQAIRLFHMPMSELVKRAREGDDKALFDAVLVDSCAIACPSISDRIHQAKVADDKEFFDHLAAAIKGSRPRRPKEEHDDLRFMMTALDEATGLGNLSKQQLSDLFIDQLQLYSDTGEDPESGLKKLLQRRAKAVGT